LGLGANLAQAVTELSERDVQFLATQHLDQGQEIELELQTPVMGRPLKLVADVTSCVVQDDGTFLAHAEWRHSLTRPELLDLIQVGDKT
jgi:hypothetical protein